MTRWLALFLTLAVTASAQRPQLSDGTRAYVAVDAPVVALTNARVIDGTGAEARAGQTIVIEDGNIVELGDTARITIPSGATTIDLAGKSVIPGLVT